MGLDLCARAAGVRAQEHELRADSNPVGGIGNSSSGRAVAGTGGGGVVLFRFDSVGLGMREARRGEAARAPPEPRRRLLYGFVLQIGRAHV